MIHNGTFNITPGKKVTCVTLKSLEKIAETVQCYELEYTEEPILTVHDLVQFRHKEKTYIGFVTNPWFEGAYGIPSFSCSHVLCTDTGNVETREQTFRFKNVEIGLDADKDVYNESLLKTYNITYFPTIKAIDTYVPRLDEYYWVNFSADKNMFTVEKSKDMNGDIDKLKRSSNNYFETVEKAESLAARLNIQLGL